MEKTHKQTRGVIRREVSLVYPFNDAGPVFWLAWWDCLLWCQQTMGNIKPKDPWGFVGWLSKRNVFASTWRISEKRVFCVQRNALAASVTLAAVISILFSAGLDNRTSNLRSDCLTSIETWGLHYRHLFSPLKKKTSCDWWQVLQGTKYRRRLLENHLIQDYKDRTTYEVALSGIVNLRYILAPKPSSPYKKSRGLRLEGLLRKLWMYFSKPMSSNTPMPRPACRKVGK